MRGLGNARSTSLNTIRCRPWRSSFLPTRNLSDSGQFSTNEDLFRYTSGRWLYNEQQELSKRSFGFNISGLRDLAAETLGDSCVEVAKVSENLYSKTLSLKTKRGEEVFAKLPNPKSTNPRSVVASEVATIDYVRNILDIPVPKVLTWSSPRQQNNPVEAEYILMEPAKGRKVSDVWDTMSDSQQIGLVKSVVALEQTLLNTKFASHGSLYYHGAHPDDSLHKAQSTADDETSRFFIGPTNQSPFWRDHLSYQSIDRGPWGTALEYLTAVANCEIALVRYGNAQAPGYEFPSYKIQKHTEEQPEEPVVDFPITRLEKVQALDYEIFQSRTPKQREEHAQVLEKFLAVLPYILPPEDFLRSVLHHHDLSSDNIFVDDSDPTKITSILGWQGLYTAPLFMQTGRIPAIFDPTQNRSAEILDQRLELMDLYEQASRQANPALSKIIDTTHPSKTDDDPTISIHQVMSTTSLSGPFELKELLIRIYEQWDSIKQQRSLDIPCPISFSDKEIRRSRELLDKWRQALALYRGLLVDIGGDAGWVSHMEHKKASEIWESYRLTLNSMRDVLERMR
ncbi:hypothetical protein BJY04DRAFT_200076 [Aspergillus karnatakaensis]|uniref:uncharacterized protein n=1 Tax=Aspergillus karnatakaensis TaxID=1810916 RepID=UPI003CCCB11B